MKYLTRATILLPLLALLLSVGSGCRSLVQKRLEAEVSSGAEFFDFASETPFDWDRLHVFEPYTSKDTVEAELGFAWPQYRRTSIESSDGINLVVFVKKHAVVHWYEQPRKPVDLDELANGLGYSRLEASFRFCRKPGWTRLRGFETTSDLAP